MSHVEISIKIEIKPTVAEPSADNQAEQHGEGHFDTVGEFIFLILPKPR
jgi:hypothetical protein